MRKHLLLSLALGLAGLAGTDAYGQCVSITCPSNIVAYAGAGSCDAAIAYTDPLGTNTCGSPTSVTFNYTAPSLQTFTVPVGVTSIMIDASGAQGGSVTTTCAATGGLGARIQGEFTVTPGEVLSIMVGQQGLTNGSDAGGGGGTFVVRTGNVCLVAAGGGGGATNNIGQCGSNRNGIDATITTSGTASGNGLVAGGVNGNGGGASTGSGGGGGGFLTNGVAGTGLANNNGKAYVNGGAGGTGNNNDFGGYGGGGAGWFTGGNGGGGGGYSGGATSGSQPFTGGGGGGSFNGGTNQTNTAGFQTGNGRVIITYTVAGPAYTSLIAGLGNNTNYPLGITTVAYAVTDSAGSNDSCSFTVEVLDTIAPSISCPADTTLSNDPGTCAAVYSYTTPSGADNCGATTALTAGLASGSGFPSGVTAVTYEATDSAGNSASCSFAVTVMVDDSSTQSVSICDGASYTIGSSTYTAAGTYTDVLQNGGGCDSVVTTILTVDPAINTGTTVSGGTISANASGASYQWIDCGTGNAIPGATSQDFQPSVDGSYAVVVTVGNCSDTSSCDAVVGMAGTIGTEVTLQPNPSNGRATLTFGRVLQAVQVDVCDLAGKTLASYQLEAVQQHALDLSQQPSGVYLVRIRTELGQQSLRLVKQD